MPGSDDAQERDAIARSQRGDANAFNLLVARYESAAYSLALRMLGNPDSAADVTQDAFFSAYRNIRAFRGASFRSWLLRIVSNGCYDHWRAQVRRPAESLDALLAGDDEGAVTTAVSPELARSLTDPTWSPESVTLRAESHAAIEAALLRLPPDQRLVIILSDIQGYSYDEVARIASVPLGTVKSRIARARQRLREILLGQPELFPGRERRDVRGD